MKKIFFIFIVAIAFFNSYGQSSSRLVTGKDLNELLARNKIYIGDYFKWLSKLITDSTNVLNVHHAKMHVAKYNYSKNAIKYITFTQLETVWLFNSIEKDTLFASLERNGISDEYVLGPPMPSDINVFNVIRSHQADIKNARLFTIDGLNEIFVEKKGFIYVVDTIGLIEFGKFYSKKYKKVKQFRTYANPELK